MGSWSTDWVSSCFVYWHLIKYHVSCEKARPPGQPERLEETRASRDHERADAGGAWPSRPRTITRAGITVHGGPCAFDSSGQLGIIPFCLAARFLHLFRYALYIKLWCLDVTRGKENLKSAARKNGTFSLEDVGVLRAWILGMLALIFPLPVFGGDWICFSKQRGQCQAYCDGRKLLWQFGSGKRNLCQWDLLYKRNFSSLCSWFVAMTH